MASNGKSKGTPAGGTQGFEDAVDCYLITKDRVKAGTVVQCEPIGLLEQDEDGEIDHKVLPAAPGQDVELGEELLKQLQGFIYAVFSQFPEIRVSVGRILSREAALRHLEEYRDARERSSSIT